MYPPDNRVFRNLKGIILQLQGRSWEGMTYSKKTYTCFFLSCADYKLIYKDPIKLFKRIITVWSEKDESKMNLKSGLWAIELL